MSLPVGRYSTRSTRPSHLQRPEQPKREFTARRRPSHAPIMAGHRRPDINNPATRTFASGRTPSTATGSIPGPILAAVAFRSPSYPASPPHALHRLEAATSASSSPIGPVEAAVDVAPLASGSEAFPERGGRPVPGRRMPRSQRPTRGRHPQRTGERHQAEPVDHTGGDELLATERLPMARSGTSLSAFNRPISSARSSWQTLAAGPVHPCQGGPFAGTRTPRLPPH
jgi:hypothetical protein